MRLIDADTIITDNPEIMETLQDAPTVKNAVVLPFMPGDDLWYLDEDDGYRVKCYADDDKCDKIHGVAVYKDRFEIIGLDGLSFPAGKIYSCTSEAEAVAMRKKILISYLKDHLSSQSL